MHILYCCRRGREKVIERESEREGDRERKRERERSEEGGKEERIRMMERLAISSENT